MEVKKVRCTNQSCFNDRNALVNKMLLDAKNVKVTNIRKLLTMNYDINDNDL